MESPTREIRCSLQALKLQGHMTRVGKDTSASTAEEVRNLQRSAVHNPREDGYRPSSDMLAKEPRPIFAGSQQTQDGQYMLQSHAECSGATNSVVHCSNSSQHCRRDGTQCTIQNSPGISSPSSVPSNWVAGSSAQSMVVARSCREQAAAAACKNSFDDTTVDDLAGYLDEIMFIPKPMSEMAELMYT